MKKLLEFFKNLHIGPRFGEIPLSSEPIYRAEIYSCKAHLVARKQELILAGVKKFDHSQMVAYTETHVIFIVHMHNLIRRINGLTLDEVVFAYMPDKDETEVAVQRTWKNKGKVYDGAKKIHDWNEQPLKREASTK